MGGVQKFQDTFNRQLSYLRVSVTDRCNLNCLYCRRWYMARYFPSREILRYEELLRVIRIGAELGIDKVRITGGEPFVRKDICRFIEAVVRVPGITDVSLTTNGFLLARYLTHLQEAGIRRLNISLDSLKREKYKLITGRDVFPEVWHAIETSLAAGFSPVKINVVVMRGINEDEVGDFTELTRRYPLHVRFIEYMPSSRYRLDQHRQILSSEIKQRLADREGPGLVPVVRADNSNIAERFRYEDGRGEVGFISPISKHFCHTCNRLRLTADGHIRPCLLSDIAVPLKPALRGGSTDAELASLFRQAAFVKPVSGFAAEHEQEAGIPELMSAIGG